MRLTIRTQLMFRSVRSSTPSNDVARGTGAAHNRLGGYGRFEVRCGASEAQSQQIVEL